MREAVCWNGSGRRSGPSEMASPSSTTEATGSDWAASTSSGTRSVTSSSVRVNTATRSPSRWICTRMPSSFHSTAAGPCGRTRRPGQVRSGRASGAAVTRRRAGTVAGAAVPSARTAWATGVSVPARVTARRTSAAGRSGRDRNRLGEYAVERALAELAADQPGQQALLGRRGSRHQVARRARRAVVEPGPDRSAIAANSASTSVSPRVGRWAGGGRSRSAA